MTQYRCYLLDPSGSPFANHYIESDDERVAITEAEALLARNEASRSAELWVDSFLVRKLWKLERVEA
jgi:hypothetical protein